MASLRLSFRHFRVSESFALRFPPLRSFHSLAVFYAIIAYYCPTSYAIIMYFHSIFLRDYRVFSPFTPAVRSLRAPQPCMMGRWAKLYTRTPCLCAYRTV